MNIKIDPEFEALCPPLSTEEFEQLKESIEKEGCRDPLVRWGDTLIDGHHRFKICKELEIKFDVIGRNFDSRDDCKIWIIKNQFSRRNLTPFQRAELALKLEPLISARAKEQQGTRTDIYQNSDKSSVHTYPELAKVAGVSHDTIYKAKMISNSGNNELISRVRSGDTSINRGYMEYRKEQEPQKIITPSFPTDKYRCIVIDPPWPVKKIEREERPHQGESLDYPTMELEEIRGLPIAELSDDSAHLYLWVTHKFLPIGFELIESWGFKYQCLMTWVKPTGMTPYSWMYNTEHVLFALKGGLRLNAMGIKLSFEAPVKRHSEKPDIFYERVISASPEQRIELFSRKERAGFYGWGVDERQGVVGQVSA